MKCTKLRIAICLAWLSLPVLAHGAVEASLFHLSPSDSYTVPQGKVLLIENMILSGSLELRKGTNSLTIGSSDFGAGPAPIDRPFLALPLKIPEGWTLGVDPEFAFRPGIWIFGLVIDSSDLATSLQSRIEDVSVKGGSLSLGIRTNSGKPAQIAIEESERVEQGWQPAANAVVSPTADKTRYEASVPMEGDRKFVRARATQIE